MKLAETLVVAGFSMILIGAGTFFPKAVVASASFSATFVIVAGSVMAALVCREPSRAAWRGFAFFATTYSVFAVLIGDVYSAVNSQFGIAAQPPRPALITSYLLAWAYDRIGHPEIWTSGGSRVPSLHLLRVREAIPSGLEVSTYDAFMNIGHCLFTVWMGLVGGWIGRRLNDGEAMEA